MSALGGWAGTLLGGALLLTLAGCTARHAPTPPPPPPPEPIPDPEPAVVTPPVATEPGLEELRGIWVTRWTYDSPEDVEEIFAQIAAAGLNTVFFQVRGQFDAYYPSEHEPWAARLTGTLGRDPGWDPLATAIAAARVHDLQIHAYLNVFTLWRGIEEPSSEGLPHPYAQHPDWAVANAQGVPMAPNETYVFANPAHPEVRRHLVSVVQDVGTRYALDGIHLDYLRYPAIDYSHDPVSEARFQAEAAGSSRADWQREQIHQTLLEMREQVSIPMSAAVWGIYHNPWDWPRVSRGNRDYYQDSQAYLERGLLDAIVPMIYWPVSDPPGGRLDFRTLLRDHLDHQGDRHVYAGMGGEAMSLEQLIRCIEVVREEGAQGFVIFDYSLFAGSLSELAIRLLDEPARPPEQPWRVSDGGP